MRLPLFASFAAIALFSLSPADAQRREPTPEQRIDRLEKQVQQVQRRVFGRQPADTAGFIDDPAATQSTVNTLATRLDSIERQLAEIVRTSEENSNRLATMEAELARVRADQDSRLRALETAADAAAAAEPGAATTDSEPLDAPPPAPRPRVETRAEPPTPLRLPRPGDATFEAAGEEAYDQGYQLWLAGRYDEAITTLRAMASSFPGHRRVSWANNLAGRALLDKGQPRAAAEALLANYRSNPKGERAPDSLFYLGQALAKLGQSSQACKAYAELTDVYGPTMRAELKRLLPAAKTQAKCS